jgi:hypothetical protein
VNDSDSGLGESFAHLVSRGCSQLCGGIGDSLRDFYGTVVRILTQRGVQDDSLAQNDRAIKENATLNLRCVLPPSASESNPAAGAILFLHGLNEKNWQKYESWAQALALRSGRAVVQIPIAFHMDRAPKAWSDPKLMIKASAGRVASVPGLKASSLANVALSTRLDDAPERLFLAGYQSLHDVQDVRALLRSGGFKGVSASADISWFGYSIGAFLLQALALCDQEVRERGRVFLFCGGPHLSEMTPVSRYIMDSQAHERIYDYYVNKLEEETRGVADLRDLLYSTVEGEAFRSLITPHGDLQGWRRDAFRSMRGRFSVIGMESDAVIPAPGIKLFFEGTGIEPSFIQMPAECSHETPFPEAIMASSAQAASGFDRVFKEAAELLAG